MEQPNPEVVKEKRKFLQKQERTALILFLKQKFASESWKSKKLPPGTLLEAATKYECSTRLVQKL